jgi:hypothetical protein
MNERQVVKLKATKQDRIVQLSADLSRATEAYQASSGGDFGLAIKMVEAERALETALQPQEE